MYRSPSIVRVIKSRSLIWAGNIARMQEDRNTLGSGSWEDNIRMSIKEIGVNIRNWIVSGEDRDYWTDF